MNGQQENKYWWLKKRCLARNPLLVIRMTFSLTQSSLFETITMSVRAEKIQAIAMI